jgi:hypothetical protein
MNTKKAYQPPRVVEYGPIGDHTFTTPGGYKHGATTCELDKFEEHSCGGTLSAS